MSGRGKRHHLKMADIPIANRVNRGERLIEFGDDDTIATIAASD